MNQKTTMWIGIGLLASVCCTTQNIEAAGGGSAPTEDPGILNEAVPQKSLPLFSFGLNVSLSYLDPDVEEARVMCVVHTKDASDFSNGMALSDPLNLDAENQPVAVNIYEVEKHPNEYTGWQCVLLFQLAGETSNAIPGHNLWPTANSGSCPQEMQAFDLKLCVPGAVTIVHGSFATKP